MRQTIKNMLLATFFLNSCGDNFDIDKLSETPPAGYVRATLTVLANPDKLIASRATEIQEKAYDPDNVWVLVFDVMGKLTELPVKAENIGGTLSVVLESTLNARKVYVLANLLATQKAFLATAGNFNIGSITYDDLNTNAVFVTPAISTSGMMVDDSNYIPMFSQPIELMGTATLTDLIANMERINAKIEVKKTAFVTNFILESITLANGALHGHLFPQTPIATNRGGIQKYDEIAVGNTIYLHENSKGKGTPSDNPTYVVIKGKFNGSNTYTYYRIDLTDSRLPQPYPAIDIVRNTLYTINITGVTSAGYANYDEAAATLSSNIHYDIRATDINSHDVIDNGQYYLGVSNSELFVYGTGALSNLVAATITTDAPASVTHRTISATSIAGGTISVNPTVLSSMTTIQDVQITIDSLFTSGSITITTGNLVKTIKVIRKPAITVVQQVLSDFSADMYVIGQKEVNNTENKWLRFSNNANGISSADEISNSEGIYLVVATNIDLFKDNPARSCYAYLSRKSSEGRVKVFAMQDSFIITLNSSYSDFNY